jgi:hypothetical protein
MEDHIQDSGNLKKKIKISKSWKYLLLGSETQSFPKGTDTAALG